MAKPRKNSREVRWLVRLLESDQEWETPEDFAVALIEAVDQARLDSTPWIGVLQFGEGSQMPVYVALGPYPGRRTAQNALTAHPAAAEACIGVVAPLYSAERLEKDAKVLDAPPSPSGDWEQVKRDAIAFKKGFRGKAAARDAFLREQGVS